MGEPRARSCASLCDFDDGSIMKKAANLGGHAAKQYFAWLSKFRQAGGRTPPQCGLALEPSEDAAEVESMR